MSSFQCAHCDFVSHSGTGLAAHTRGRHPEFFQSKRKKKPVGGMEVISSPTKPPEPIIVDAETERLNRTNKLLKDLLMRVLIELS